MNMRFSKSRLRALGALVTLVVSAAAATADDRAICTRQSGDAAIAACSRVIESGEYSGVVLAALYLNRGVEYNNKGDLDRAVADYDQALRIDPKYALAYNNRGNSWKAKGDLDRAIADYNEALQLDPTYALVYTNRGSAWKAKGDLDRAIADYDHAIGLNPSDAHAYNSRGNAYRYKGDFDRGIADYGEAIRLDPKYGSAYNNRGTANFIVGVLPRAVADLEQAGELAPHNAYVALWFEIANRRSNLSGRLAEATKQIDMRKWPAPVIRLYLGQLTPAAVLAAADNPNAKMKMGQVCEANFYTGELALQQGRNDEAKHSFRLATADCPKSFIEYEGATAELKALDANR